MLKSRSQENRLEVVKQEVGGGGREQSEGGQRGMPLCGEGREGFRGSVKQPD